MSILTTSDLHQIFKSLDQNEDEFLGLDELSWLLDTLVVHASSDELTALVGKVSLCFDEFSDFYKFLSRKNNAKKAEKDQEWIEDEAKEGESDLYEAFKVFDLNGDGLISSQEVDSVLWKLGMWDNNGGMDCDRIMRKYDVNCDGFVDFDEFKRMMLAQ